MAGVTKTKWIWMDGELKEWEQAKVHVLTHSLHYGFGVFEGTRVYEQRGGGSSVFRLDEHLVRLEGSARILRLDLPFDREVLRAATLDLVAENGLRSCYIRHLAFIDAGVMGLNPRDNRVRIAIVTWPWGAYLGDDGLKNGVRCRISSFSRPFPNSVMTKCKATGNYVNSILAKREVVGLGYDEAILLDTSGFVSESSGANLFLVRNGVLKTPALTSVLEGITRDSIIKLAEIEGIPTQESLVTRDELYSADEVFMTGTAAEVTPVREVDDRMIGSGQPGPITKLLQDGYFSLVRGERQDLSHWLSPVASVRAAAS